MSYTGSKKMAKLLLVALLVAFSRPALSADLPPNWPWRGVEFTSAASPSEKDVEYLASINVNSIEIQMDTRLVAERNNISPVLALARDLTMLDKVLDACKKNKITLIISVSRMPLDPKSGITQESPAFWDDPEKRSEAVKIAGILASHFSRRGDELGAYEILNEPLVRGKNRFGRPAVWPSLLSSIIKEIRKHDLRRHIIVTPGPGGLAVGYGDFKPMNEERIIYGMHMYQPESYTHQGIYSWPLGVKYPGFASYQYWDKNALEASMAPLINFQYKYHVLVWIGEFSAARWAEGSNIYLADLIDIFDKHGWGWAYFSCGEYHGWSPFFDDKYTSDKPDDVKPHFIGKDSPRWKMLREAFANNKDRSTGRK